MIVYKLYGDYDNFDTCRLDEVRTETRESQQDGKPLFFEGQSIADIWGKRYYRRDHDFDLGDFCDSMETGLLLLRRTAVDKLTSHLGPIEILPISCDFGDYCVLNIMTTLDCVDMRMSKYDSLHLSKATLYFFDNYFFLEEAIGNSEIFRTVQEPEQIFVTDSFVKRVEELKLTGLSFRKLWESGMISEPKEESHLKDKAYEDALAGFSWQKLVTPIEEESSSLRVVRLIQLDGEDQAGDLAGGIQCIKRACDKLTGFVDVLVTSGGFLSVGMESEGVATGYESIMDQFEFYSALTREYILQELAKIQPVLEEKVSYLSIGVMMSAPNVARKSVNGTIQQPHVEMVGVYGVREKGFVCWTGTSLANRLQKKSLLACIDIRTHITKLKGHKMLVLGNNDVTAFEPLKDDTAEDKHTTFTESMRNGLVELLEEERPEVILHHASNSALAQLFIPAMNCVKEKYPWIRTFASGFRYVTRFIEIGQAGAEELIAQTKYGEVEDFLISGNMDDLPPENRYHL